MVGKIIPEILGFELASFSDKKSRCVWERQGASFLDKKNPTRFIVYRYGDFLKNLILGTELAIRTVNFNFKIVMKQRSNSSFHKLMIIDSEIQND